MTRVALIIGSFPERISWVALEGITDATLGYCVEKRLDRKPNQIAPQLRLGPTQLTLWEVSYPKRTQSHYNM